MSSLGQEVPLRLLTMRIATLMCLLSAQRAQTLEMLSLEYMLLDDNRCVFYIDKLLKTSRPNFHQAPLEFQAFPVDPLICVVKNTQNYLAATAGVNRASNFFISYATKKPVKSCTIAKWVCSTLELSGICVKTFGAHSVRGASTSKAKSMGLTLKQISKAAGWTADSTFSRHYNRPIEPNFGARILENSLL